jgi:hypothetical protein
MLQSNAPTPMPRDAQCQPRALSSPKDKILSHLPQPLTVALMLRLNLANPLISSESTPTHLHLRLRSQTTTAMMTTNTLENGSEPSGETLCP